MTTQAALLEEANQLFAKREYLQALFRYCRCLQENPDNISVCLSIADTLLGLGEQALAVQVYIRVARRALRQGAPLLGLWAIAKLSLEEDPHKEILANEAASLYASGSSKIQQNIAHQTFALPEDEFLRSASMLPTDDAQLIRFASELALGSKEIEVLPTLPHINLLSLFHKEVFVSAVLGLRPKPLFKGEILFDQGDKASSVFWVAQGNLTSYRENQKTQLFLGRHTLGSCVGEMALVSLSPHVASVRADTELRLLELTQELLKKLFDQSPEVSVSIRQFAREHLLKKLIRYSPFFKPFSLKKRLEIIQNFTGHDLPANTKIISEGEEGKGLYLLLSGSVGVSKEKGGESVYLATLQGGDMFGESSLITQKTTNASVTTLETTQFLFLSREVFQQLLHTTEELQEYFEKLTKERLKVTEEAISSEPMLFGEDEVTQELALDDVILV